MKASEQAKAASHAHGISYKQVLSELQKDTNWEPLKDERAESKGYQVWVDRGLWTVYQVTKLGEPAPTSESGYRILDSLLKLKNIIY